MELKILQTLYHYIRVATKYMPTLVKIVKLAPFLIKLVKLTGALYY